MSFEWALLVGLLANALAILVGVWLGTRKISSEVKKVGEEVKTVTNGVKKELMAASHLAGVNVGEARGRDVAKALLGEQRAVIMEAALDAADSQVVQATERMAERVATATERVASATERVASAAEVVTPTSKR